MKKWLSPFVVLFLISLTGFAKSISDDGNATRMIQSVHFVNSALKLQGISANPIFASTQATEGGTAVIKGTLLNLEGDAHLSAFVEAFTPDSLVGPSGEYHKGISTVNADGSFKIDSLHAGDYFIIAWAEGYLTKYYESASTTNDAQVVTVAEGQVLTGIDIRMEKDMPGTGGISGMVRRADTNASIPFASVSAFSAADFRGYSAVTDENGFYRLTGLKTGEYYVSVWADSFIFQYYSGTQVLDEATLVPVTEPNETTNIDFEMVLGGKIKGRIVDQQGHPVPFMPVEAVIAIRDSVVSSDSTRPLISFMGIGKGMTEYDGTFEIKGLPTDTVFVRTFVWDSNGWYHQEIWYHNVSAFEQATPIPVTEGKTVAGIDFVVNLSKTFGTVSGKVIDVEGNPLADATVQFQSIPESSDKVTFWTYTRTDKEGIYRSDRLPAAQYYISAWAQSGWQFVQRWYPDAATMDQAQPVSVDSESEVTGIDFRLPVKIGTATIAGFVRDSDGKPVPWANIQVAPVNSSNDEETPRIWAWAATDSNGFYKVGQLLEDTYTVYASAWRENEFAQQWFQNADSPENAVPVSLGNDETRKDIDFSLTFRPMYGAIVGKVVDQETGLPIRRAFVELKPKYRDYFVGIMPWWRIWYYQNSAITDDNGEFVFEWLWEGEYLLAVYANGGFAYYENAIVPSEATPIKVVGGEKFEVKMALKIRHDGNGAITGTVLTEWQDQPFDIAVVKAKPAITITLWPDSELFYSAVTDEKGNYALKGLPPGDYYVQSFAPYAVAEYYDNVFDPSQATLVEIIDDKPVPDINFLLSPMYLLRFDGNYRGAPNGGAVIAGKVNDAAGNPLSDATVTIYNDMGQPMASVQTDSEGAFQLGGVPAGNYRLQAGKPGYESVFNDGAVDFSKAESVQMGNGMYQIHFALDPKKATQVPKTDPSAVPTNPILYGNYPNPFNPETRISFALPREMRVTLRIFNLKGEQIRELYSGVLGAGAHALIWDSKNSLGDFASSGLYLYRLESEQVTLSGKMLLLR